MPVFVEGGGNAFGALAFGMPHQGTLSFLENRLQQTSEYLTDTGREFMSRGLEIFDRYGGSEALRHAKAAIRAVQHAFDSDAISFLSDIGAIQQAPISMQRWIMAMPEVRKLFHEQRCDGYSESYVDYHPGDIGKKHYDWRVATQGVIFETPDDPDYAFSVTNWFEEEPDDVQLSLREKMDIQNTWDVVRDLFAKGKEDPTSPYCDKL